jgi:hypothetical protein
MATAYVRSPISGTITGRDKYCGCPGVCNGNGSNHSTCRGWASPVDIGGSGNLVLRVNYPTVQSIKTLIGDQCCCDPCPDEYERTVTVELYGQPNAACYIGSVMYGHVSNPQVNHNTIYNLTSGNKTLGTVPGGSCNSCAFGSCYTGAHSHMERLGGTTVAPCCCTGVTGSTNIYKWTFECPI